MSACASGATSEPTEAGTSVLTIGVRNLHAYSMPLYWAEAAGYFEDAGLDINLVVGEAAQTSQLVAGQTDLYFGSQGGLFGITNSGKAMHTIYAESAGVNGYVVTSNPDVTSPEDCVSFTTVPPGLATSAWTTQLEEIYGVQWELAQLTTIPAIVANVVAGRTNCAGGNLSFYQTSIDEGTLKVILDPADTANLPAGWPELGIEDVIGGLPEVLEEKRSAVERFLKAYDTALQDYIAADPKDIADTLIVSDSAWATLGTPELVASLIEPYKQFLRPDDGFITEDTWKRTVTFFENGGLEFLANDPSRFDYAESVDMSFYEAAVEK